MTAYFGLLDVGAPKRAIPSWSPVLPARWRDRWANRESQGMQRGRHRRRRREMPLPLDELGFDAAIDYKAEDVRKAACARTAPMGSMSISTMLAATFSTSCSPRSRGHARIVVCGAISQYNNTTPIKGPSNYLSLLVNRARMEGMVCSTTPRGIRMRSRTSPPGSPPASSSPARTLSVDWTIFRKRC